MSRAGLKRLIVKTLELKQVLKVFNAKLLDILKSIRETTERADIVNKNN